MVTDAENLPLVRCEEPEPHDPHPEQPHGDTSKPGWCDGVGRRVAALAAVRRWRQRHPDRLRQQQLEQAADRRAQTRLARMFPREYNALRAEERAKLATRKDTP